MNLDLLINWYKQKQKRALLDEIDPTYTKKYAVIGVGKHSLSTLYPLLTFLSVPVAYILTRKSSFGSAIAKKFPEAVATHNYDLILNDPEIHGLFICSKPNSHYQLTQEALKAGKHVFVEKPVCFSSQELKRLLDVCSTNCIVGLQKRYSKVNQILKQKLTKSVSYYLRYTTGAYPEGSPVYELFIHPIDNVVFLFGSAVIGYLKKSSIGNGVLLTVQLEHDSGVYGVLELSTAHSWSDPIDHLRIETATNTFQVNYPNYIACTPKPKDSLGMPLEKIRKTPLQTKILYHNTGFEHTLENNILYEAGYYGQLKKFIDLVEDRCQSAAPSGLQNLGGTYAILDAINKLL